MIHGLNDAQTIHQQHEQRQHSTKRRAQRDTQALVSKALYVSVRYPHTGRLCLMAYAL